MTTRPVYIYALRDPRTREIRYIGSSVQPRKRLYQHHAEARKRGKFCTFGRTRHGHSPWYRRLRYLTYARERRLYGLEQAGLRAQLLILEECGDDMDSWLRETALILAYSRHARLFNVSTPRPRGTPWDLDLVDRVREPARPEATLTLCEQRWERHASQMRRLGRLVEPPFGRYHIAKATHYFRHPPRYLVAKLRIARQLRTLSHHPTSCI